MIDNNCEHIQKATDLFKMGYNCSQSVFAAFCDVTGMDEQDALRLSSSFGGGMGRLREVCGAVSGMFMIAGMLYGYSDAKDDNAKAEHYKLIQNLAFEFKKQNGSIICRELLDLPKADYSPTPTARTETFYENRPCVEYVADAARIMDELIKNK